ncbi:MAG: hypothetical protein ACLU91_00300 [Oscillibacter sp.]|jgi:hypothetical protein
MAHGHCRFSSSARALICICPRALICICHGYIGCFFFEHISSPVGAFFKSFVEFQLNMTDRELILKQILEKGNGSCKKSGKIYRLRGEFYAPKSVNRSFAARLWAANKDSAPENFTKYIQTHCKSRAILYGKLRVPLFQGGV